VAGPYCTDNEVLDLVAAGLHVGTRTDLDPTWTTLVPTAVSMAYNDVVSPWLIRGYDISQLDVWPPAAAYNKLQAMWYLSTMGVLCTDYQKDPFDRYNDLRELLDKAADVRALTNSASTAVAPSIDAPVGGAAYGTLSASNPCNWNWAQRTMFGCGYGPGSTRCSGRC
jgi:hypothetical protein